jgi:hypothetical protein
MPVVAEFCLRLKSTSTDYIGFGEVDYKSMQLDEDWEFFYFLNHLSRIGSCSLARSILVLFLRAFRGMVVG